MIINSISPLLQISGTKAQDLNPISKFIWKN